MNTIKNFIWLSIQLISVLIIVNVLFAILLPLVIEIPWLAGILMVAFFLLYFKAD